VVEEWNLISSRDRSAREDQHVKVNDPSKLRGTAPKFTYFNMVSMAVVAWIGNS
jgi:hypothetical protein